jgi:hypothetical protein
LLQAVVVVDKLAAAAVQAVCVARLLRQAVGVH